MEKNGLKMNEEELKNLEKQLSCPTGEQGIEVANKMNSSNFDMTLNSIKNLNLKPQQLVLELGHGNCGHLNEILNRAEQISYHGLEISELMKNEAIRLNPNYHKNFGLYDGEEIPFKNSYFDTVFSVNTIYFWANPTKLIKEIERVLKPNGICVISFANKSFMKTLPFVNKRFNLFGKSEIENLIISTNLKITDYQIFSDNVVSKSGENVCREYSVVKLTN